MTHVISIDFEEYFQGILTIDPSTYDSYPGRIEALADRILHIFDRYSISATFFISGYTAERYPGLVKRIHRAGHEIASHG